MMNCVAFFGSVPTGTAYTPVAALGGTNEYIQNNHHIFTEDFLLLAAFVGSSTPVRSRLVWPSGRIVAPTQIRPLHPLVTSVADPNIADFREMPMRIKAREEVSLEAAHSAGGSENWYGVLFLGDGSMTVPRGQPYVIRATAATTLVVNTWTNVPLTFEDVLPDGEYAIIGMEAFSAGAIAARLVFPGRPLYRPGIPAGRSATDKPYKWFGEGEFGEFGRFVTTALPSVEFLSLSADTAETVFLRLIKVR